MMVNVVARRARQIAAEAEVTGEPLPEKPVTMAIGEVAEGKYVSDPVIEEDEARGGGDRQGGRTGGYLRYRHGL